MSFTFSPLAGISAALGGAISQGLGRPHEWGQGLGPYGNRVASSFGSSVVGGSITYGMSVLFRDDNRYFRSNSDKISTRLAAVLLSPYVAHNEAGRPRFSVSSFLGGAGQATIPLEWSPRSWQGWNNAGVNYLIWYSQTAGMNLARELYTGFLRYSKNKGQSKAMAAIAATKK